MYINGIKKDNVILIIDENFASIEKIETQDPDLNVSRDFYFNFNLKVSQTLALRENALSVIVSLKTQNKEIPVIVQNSSNIDPERLVNNILTNSIKIKKQNDLETSYLIAEKTLDITSKIDNQLLNSFKTNSLNTNNFAKTKILVKKKNDQEEVNLEIQRAPVFSTTLFGDLSVIKSELNRNLTLKKQRFKLLNSGISPTKITSVSNKTMTPYAAITGCVSSLQKDNSRNLLLDSLSFFQHSEEIYDESRQKNENKYETVIEQTFEDLIDVNLKMILKESYIRDSFLIAEFKLIKRIIDSKNQIQQVIIEQTQRKLNIRKCLEDFLSNPIPLSVSASRSNYSTTFQIKNNSEFPCTVNIFSKKIQDFNNRFFTKIDSIDMDFKNQISIFQIPQGNNSIYRFLLVDKKTTQVFNDFTDIVLKNKRQICDANIVIIPQIIKGKIYVKVIKKSYDLDIIACKILYKNVTKKEKYKIAEILTFSDNEYESEYSFAIDENLIPYNDYEITAKLIFENGVEVDSSNKTHLKAIPYLGDIASINVTNILKTSDITFNIQAQLVEDQTDLITNLLTQVSARYDSNYYLNKEAEFDKFVAFQVFRYDLSDGDCIDLGIVSNNTSFSDRNQSTKKSVYSVINLNNQNQEIEDIPSKFRYIIYPLIRDPNTVTETEKEFIDVETKKRYKVNLRKSRHPVTLNRGNVLSKSRIDKDVIPDMSYGMIGSSYAVDITIENKKNLIENFTANFISNKKVLLTWDINGNLNFFDHILVFKNDGGIKTLIGKVHCLLRESNNFNYSYSLTKNDIGNINFILVPIHINYDAGNSVMSNYLLVDNVE